VVGRTLPHVTRVIVAGNGCRITHQSAIMPMFVQR